jgi:hypothetical protein
MLSPVETNVMTRCHEIGFKSDGMAEQEVLATQRLQARQGLGVMPFA